VKKLALYEPPFALDGTHAPRPADFREQIASMLTSGRRADAVDLFGKVVGAPAVARFFMRFMPGIAPKLRDVAHTLPYDFAVLGDTQSGGAIPAELREKLHAIQAPTLAMAGGKSPPWMHHAARKVAESVGHGVFRVVAGQDHNVAAKAIAPRLVEAFAS
jgi:pimeloyl-ACP methyl ester carboxylesterase